MMMTVMMMTMMIVMMMVMIIDDNVLQNRSKLGGESNKEENTDTSDSLGKKSSLFADTSVPQKCKGYFQPYLLPHPEELGEFPWCIGFTIFLQTKDITEVKYHLDGEKKEKLEP